jgi:hypothetical protein
MHYLEQLHGFDDGLGFAGTRRLQWHEHLGPSITQIVTSNPLHEANSFPNHHRNRSDLRLIQPA